MMYIYILCTHNKLVWAAQREPCLFGPQTSGGETQSLSIFGPRKESLQKRGKNAVVLQRFSSDMFPNKTPFQISGEAMERCGFRKIGDVF